MLNEKPWREVVKQASHYLAIGLTQVYLFEDGNKDFPWEFVVSCEPGGSHRLDKDVRFTARHPSGIVFTWSIDIEERDASGCGHYKIATKRIAGILSVLDGQAKKDFQAYLASCSVAVEKTAMDYFRVYESNLAASRALKELAQKA